ncbi:MAG: HAMP domain-containing histidine kinase [Geminicoccaceae bacterium]|nr:HAMP domain-containing histidine kinase [Geminicoccaceae bacterium]
MPLNGNRVRLGRGLSARVLGIAVSCVLLGEVLIYLPSIARFWQTYLEERIAAAHLAALVPSVIDHDIDIGVVDDLLIYSGTVTIVVRDPESQLMLGELPVVDRTYWLSETSAFDLVLNAFETLYSRGRRFIRVIGNAPMKSGTEVDIVLADAHLYSEMVAYSRRVLFVSLLLSAIVASLLFVSLQRVIIQPLGQIARQLTEFRRHPEDSSVTATPRGRSDEIGVVERELIEMQQDLRQALAGKARLAALGEAVSRINHDLRNSLSSALLVSDRLERSDDPSVRDATPRLVRALERAIRLCEATLSHARNRPQPLRLAPVPLAELVREVVADVVLPYPGIEVNIDVSAGTMLRVDRDEMHRMLTNLVRNAIQAMADGGRIAVRAAMATDGGFRSLGGRGHGIVIAVEDSGRGISGRMTDQLFEPFASGGQGAGLGLAIAREIARRHGGDVRLASTGAEGTCFEIILPQRAVIHFEKS